MKVLFVCSGNNRYGITPLIKSQGDSLIRAGVAVEYFRILGKGLPGYVAAVFRLRHWLKKNWVDLLHAHYGLCGWVGYWAKPKRMPLVLSYMGSDILLDRKGKPAPRALGARLNRALQNRVNHVIVKSDNLKAVLHRKTGISIVPNGVDINHFKPLAKEDCRTRLGLAFDKRIVLFLGNPDDHNKNIHLAKNAIDLIASSATILLSPFPVDPGQVPLYLNAADGFILSSISEGSPNVIKEAMACNCPIVATDVGDVRWLMGDTPGCFISLFSAADMAAKIKMALDFNKRTTGRERIIKLGLDSDRVAKQILGIYESVLKPAK